MAMESENDPSPFKPPKFRVIIAGGGMAGLTLANALQHSKHIDYILLERRSDIAPQLGASIGIGPAGWRILDQIGSANKLFNFIEPLIWIGNHGKKGEDITPIQDGFQLLHKRLVYHS